LSSEFTHHQEEHEKHRGAELHTHMNKVPLLSRGFLELSFPSAKVNLRKLLQCSLDFLTIGVSLVCHVPSQKWSFQLQITDSSKAMID